MSLSALDPWLTGFNPVCICFASSSRRVQASSPATASSTTAPPTAFPTTHYWCSRALTEAKLNWIYGSHRYKSFRKCKYLHKYIFLSCFNFYKCVKCHLSGCRMCLSWIQLTKLHCDVNCWNKRQTILLFFCKITFIDKREGRRGSGMCGWYKCCWVWFEWHVATHIFNTVVDFVGALVP